MSKPKDTSKETGQSADQSQQQGSGATQQGGTDQTQGKEGGSQNGQETAEAAAARIAKENEAETNRIAEENRTKERERVAEEERVAKANRDRETAARTEAARQDRERAEAAARGGNVTQSDKAARRAQAPDFTTRENDVRANQTPREAQIARANEAMERKNDDSTDGAKALASAHDDEEAIYAKLKDAPPTSGRARDENTPTEILADGTKVWGTPVA